MENKIDKGDCNIITNEEKASQLAEALVGVSRRGDVTYEEAYDVLTVMADFKDKQCAMLVAEVKELQGMIKVREASIKHCNEAYEALINILKDKDIQNHD